MPFATTNTEFGAEASKQIQEAASFSHGHAHQAMTFLIPMPLLANSDDEPLPCYEPPEETAAVSAHVSKSIHAYYKQLTAYFANLESPPERVDLRLTFDRQDFDNKPDECYHRNFHSRRLLLENANTLPDLPVVTRFTFDSRKHYADSTSRKTGAHSPSLSPCNSLSICQGCKSSMAPGSGSAPCPPLCPASRFASIFHGLLRGRHGTLGMSLVLPS